MLQGPHFGERVMAKDGISAPANYHGVMVSSTFKDLEQHRAALMNALRKEELFTIGMEDYIPSPDDDVISSSLNMVRKGSGWFGLISHHCAQVPDCAAHNPAELWLAIGDHEQAKKTAEKDKKYDRSAPRADPHEAGYVPTIAITTNQNFMRQSSSGPHGPHIWLVRRYCECPVYP